MSTYDPGVKWEPTWRASILCGCRAWRTGRTERHRRAEALHWLEAKITATCKATDPRSAAVKGVVSHTHGRRIDSVHKVSVVVDVRFRCRECNYETPWVEMNDEARVLLLSHDCEVHRRSIGALRDVRDVRSVCS